MQDNLLVDAALCLQSQLSWLVDAIINNQFFRTWQNPKKKRKKLIGQHALSNDRKPDGKEL